MVLAWLAAVDPDAGDAPIITTSIGFAASGLALIDSRLVVKQTMLAEVGIDFQLTATDKGGLSLSRALTLTSGTCAAGQHDCSLQATCQPVAAGGHACTCHPGYVGNGRTCELRQCLHPRPGHICTALTDTCASEPCANGGTCADGRTPDGQPTYTCRCPIAWAGERCEDDVDECAAVAADSPCRNGGTCLQRVGDATVDCACLPDYVGSRCQLPRFACAAAVCPSGTSCVPTLRPDGPGYACARPDRALELLYEAPVDGGCPEASSTCSGTWAASQSVFIVFAARVLVTEAAEEEAFVWSVREVAGRGTVVSAGVLSATEPAGLPPVQLYARLQRACLTETTGVGFCAYQLFKVRCGQASFECSLFTRLLTPRPLPTTIPPHPVLLAVLYVG